MFITTIIRLTAIRYLIPLLILLFSQGCTTVGLKSYNPPPVSLENEAQVPGFTNVRGWADSYSPSLEKSALDSVHQELNANHGKLQPEVNALALSGGGQNGAFGAGILCGWTASGKRPQFKLVTGISTGALMAPFAFLGSEYDEELKKAYTTVSDRNIYKMHNPVALLLAFSNLRPLPSVAANTGLAQMIEKMIDAALLKKVAAEHLKGRRLLIGTTQFNAQRLVIWDMGAIAVKNTPEALALFRKVLLASASIPVDFPPQYFTVEARGQEFQEMHVDGGVEADVILFENSIQPFSDGKNWYKARKSRNLYIIRNQKVTPEWQYVSPQIRSIAKRAISSLIKSQGTADLYQLYTYAQRDGINYNLAFIPTNFTIKAQSHYDQVYMNALFQRGYAMGRSGHPWLHYPPGFARAAKTS